MPLNNKNPETQQNAGKNAIEMLVVKFENETYFKITNHDSIRPFFMSLVSDSNHWMFVSSNGGLTAGRKNSEFALFPYYTDDKITESAENTGSKTILKVIRNGKTELWEPFSIRFEGKFRVTRNLYKSEFGNKILFEEINHDLGLTFRYQWNSSNLYGFVKKSQLVNDLQTEQQVTVLDGLQNILSFGIGSDLQTRTSNLADAYKRNELHAASGLGIYALSAIIVDKAEPSEALKANIVWSLGLQKPAYLLSTLQLNRFRNNQPIDTEIDVKGEKGAYFVVENMQLAPGSTKEWMIVGNVNQNHSEIIRLTETIQNDSELYQKILQDIDAGTSHLAELVAAADGQQHTADAFRDTRHFSNVLFNIMRGGIIDDNYTLEKHDFVNHLYKSNRKVWAQNQGFFDKLAPTFTLFELQAELEKSNDRDLIRIATEYLPLKFSRRHGDPSRPWNAFSINTRSEIDGSKILDYEGNWRDIFQNWEALAHSYPGFIKGMIFKFLNASTFDGYNPYRVTKDGFDWETIEPDNPWSYIGYWGDHQIIYLLKFLEFAENYYPNLLQELFDQECFVYAHVPYRIKTYADILAHPKNTIDFDRQADHAIVSKRQETGADGALLCDRQSNVYHVNFVEKILATLLSKLSNYVPGAGIWMNTQRPEWNDANNALVGNGVSMVTLCYLHRFLKFFGKILASAPQSQFAVSEEMQQFFTRISEILQNEILLPAAGISDTQRKQVIDALGETGSDFRNQIYDNAFSGAKCNVQSVEIIKLIESALQTVEQTIATNVRPDHLYHAYNLLSYNDHSAWISHLDEMLEGQVAVLSSGFLAAEESLQLLDSLEKSALYRPDQNSYILYPNKRLKGFLEKNTIPQHLVEQSELLRNMIYDYQTQLVEQDMNKAVHFNGNFKNAGDLAHALDDLANTKYKQLAVSERALLLQIFEEVFNHKAFTGRSGTFYGYEGLGSIYWHMVSKLQLAVQETCLNAIEAKADQSVVNKLIEHYYRINEGIGVHKSPALYGAFPTDPYSHTPLGKGAQQPGMTGQVKEDILSRFGELGVFVSEGSLMFNPVLLRKSEFSTSPQTIHYVDASLNNNELHLDEKSLFFTCCQVPVIYTIAETEGIEIIGLKSGFTGKLSLSVEDTAKILGRTGEIVCLKVFLKPERLIQ